MRSISVSLSSRSLTLALLASALLLTGADGGCDGGDDDDDTGEGEGEGEGEEGEGEEGEGEEGEGEEGEGEEGEGEEGEGEGVEQCPGLPAYSDPCLEGQCGNSKGVGQPCSPDGGECNDFFPLGAGFCTVDFVDDAPLAMCTRPCSDDKDCGEDAVCQGDPDDPDGDKGCIPAGCAEGG